MSRRMHTTKRKIKNKVKIPPANVRAFTLGTVPSGTSTRLAQVTNPPNNMAKGSKTIAVISNAFFRRNFFSSVTSFFTLFNFDTLSVCLLSVSTKLFVPGSAICSALRDRDGWSSHKRSKIKCFIMNKSKVWMLKEWWRNIRWYLQFDIDKGVSLRSQHTLTKIKENLWVKGVQCIIYHLGKPQNGGAEKKIKNLVPKFPFFAFTPISLRPLSEKHTIRCLSSDGRATDWKSVCPQFDPGRYH